MTRNSVLKKFRCRHGGSNRYSSQSLACGSNHIGPGEARPVDGRCTPVMLNGHGIAHGG